MAKAAKKGAATPAAPTAPEAQAPVAPAEAQASPATPEVQPNATPEVEAPKAKKVKERVSTSVLIRPRRDFPVGHNGVLVQFRRDVEVAVEPELLTTLETLDKPWPFEVV